MRNYNLKFWNCFRGRWSYCYYSSYIWTSITFAWWFDFTFTSSCIVSFQPSHVRFVNQLHFCWLLLFIWTIIWKL